MTAPASINAPGSPISPSPGPEPSWLPESPSEGILERFSPHAVLGDDDFWHEERRNAARTYLGTKLGWTPAGARQTVPVEPGDLHADLHRLMLADLRDCFPWTDVEDVLPALLWTRAGQRFGREAVKEEWATCLMLADKWEHIDAVARHVHFCRLRDERVRIIRHMLTVAHSAEAVEAACGRLREVR